MRAQSLSSTYRHVRLGAACIAFGVLIAAATSVGRAGAVTGTITPGGPPVTISTTSANETGLVTFSGTVGQRVYLKISNVSLNGGFETVDLLSPSGSSLGGSGAVTSNGYIDTTTLPVTGTYTIRIYTYGGPGSTTLTLHDVPADTAGSIEFGGAPVVVTTTVPGQDARLTFTGYADQPVRLRRSAITISTSIVKILKPDGTVLASTGAVGTPDGYLDATLPVDGTYTALVDGFKDATGSMTLSLGDPEDNAGPVGQNQSAPDGDDTVTNPASPLPVSPSGPVAPGSYTTELWSGEDSGSTDGVNVISSTASGTSALTGVVVDGTTGNAVAGANVTLAAAGTSTSTSTDSNGGYAFINMPTNTYNLSINATGYGDYTVTNAALAADDEYEQTAALLNDVQSVDVSDATPTTSLIAQTPISASDTYPSVRRPPPTIRVALHGTVTNGVSRYSCSNDFSTNPYLRTLTYPWRFYVLHTGWGEAGPGPWPNGPYFGQVGWSAVAAAINSYGWYWMRHRSPNVPSGADVDNTVNFQCFKPGALVPFSYHAYVGGVLASRIVADGTSEILQSFHLGQTTCSPNNCFTYTNVSCGGSYGFTDPTYPPPSYSAPAGTNGILSQLGAKAAEDVCHVNNWRSIINYYYRARSGTSPPGHVVDGTVLNAPPAPLASYLSGSGQTTLYFPSKVGSTPVGWRYSLERASDGVHFRVFQTKTFDWHTHSIPTSSTFAATGCWTYRVRAWNPNGWSGYVYYGVGPICA